MIDGAAKWVVQPVAWTRARLTDLVAAPGTAPETNAPTAAIGAGPAAVGPVDPQKQLAARALQSAVDVYRDGRSTGITVEFTAHDPVTAASVANAYADAYLQDMLTANAAAVGQTTAWMRGRVEELRAQAQAAAADAERFSAENGLVGTRDGDLLTSQAVSELNSRLTEAVGDAARAEATLATYDAAVAGGVEGLMAGNSLTLGGEVSDALAARISNYNDVRARLQRVTATAGPGSAQAAGLRQTLNSTAQRLFVELQAQQQEARSAVIGAKARVEALQASLDEATGRNTAQAANLVKLDALKKEAATLSELYQATLTKAQEIEQQRSFPVTNARILSYAQPPLEPSGPSTLRAMVFMMVLGLMLGIIRAVRNEARERFLRTGADVTEHSPLRFLGHLPPLPRSRGQAAPVASAAAPPPLAAAPMAGETLPVVSRRRYPMIRLPVPVLAHPDSVYAETLRHIQLAAGTRHAGVPVIGVTSFHPYADRSKVALNLAGQVGVGRESVLLIDADSRARTLSRITELEHRAGLSEVLTGTSDRDWHDLLVTIEGTNIAVLPCGLEAGGRADDLSDADAWSRILHEARTQFSAVVVDVPPLYPVAQGRSMLHDLPQFLIVAEWGRTPREMPEVALANDPELEARCLGVVFDRVNPARLRRYLPHGSAELYLGAGRRSGHGAGKIISKLTR